MDLALTYTNHLGQRVRIASGGHLHLMESDIFGHEWAYERSGQRIWGLRLDARELTLPIGMFGGSLAERTALYRALEADSMAAECGTLEFHGYSLVCVPTAMSLGAWWFADGIEERKVTLVAPRPLWTREVVTSFGIAATPEGQGTDLDYPYDYAHDWRHGFVARRLRVDTVGAAEFRLVVYGPATNPYVTIAGNRYQVNVSVPSGSYLVLDTRDRTIRMVGELGGVTNCYADRVRGRRGGGHYAFQPMPAGEHEVSSDNSFAFDIVIHDERTEPAWES